MSRLRWRTFAISAATGPVIIVPNCAACRVRYATLALQISFLLGRHAMLGQEPPIQRRSTTAVRRPDCAKCQANSLPLLPLPRTRISNCSGWDMMFLDELLVTAQRIAWLPTYRFAAAADAPMTTSAADFVSPA